MTHCWIIHLRLVAIGYGRLEMRPYSLGPFYPDELNWQVMNLQVQGYEVVAVHTRTERIA